MRVALLLAPAFVVGGICGYALRPAQATKGEGYAQLDLLAEVYSVVRENYVDPIEPEKLWRGAVSGMVRALDPHSELLDAAAVRNFTDDTKGRFAGVGLEISEKGGRLVVVAALPGGPADTAGVKSGDVVVGVDGKSTEGLRLSQSVKLLRGPAGTTVELELVRRAESLQVELERAMIEVQAVVPKLLDDKIGHLALRTFQRDAADAVREAFEALETECGGELRGVVLDLRDNPGGLLSQGVAVADLFLRDGDIVSTAGRGGGRRWSARKRGTLRQLPMVVLVNKGSASAAEIVAGALQDAGRARLVGEQTFGKASVQKLYGLEDGSGVKLTVARYYTPKGRSIHEKGLPPDIEATGPEALEVARKTLLEAPR